MTNQEVQEFVRLNLKLQSCERVGQDKLNGVQVACEGFCLLNYSDMSTSTSYYACKKTISTLSMLIVHASCTYMHFSVEIDILLLIPRTYVG